ncbi:hypothetical protein L2E82_18566 [Cichorium intybus]|uniref:Uncharacterized protein n=1 Tax=Cichorium intybus TaxID=13427 RepID=A0ACB9FA27_CICIN|nr:hypothetical protein L2E82_18566 [Cichorium intybus]
MDAFLEDGSHEATIAVIRALVPNYRQATWCIAVIEPMHFAKKSVLLTLQEALENIVKERSDGTFDTFSKVMGSQFGLPSSMTSFLTQSGLLRKKDSVEIPPPPDLKLILNPPSPAEDTRFQRIM